MRYKERFTLLPRATKDGGTVYYVRFYDPRTKRRRAMSSGEATKGRARDFGERLVRELESGQRETPRLEEFSAGFFDWERPDGWVALQHAKGRSFGRYQAQTRAAHLENHILPAFGKKRLADLTQPEIMKWLITLPLSNQTRNHILYTFRILLREAKSLRLISDNPLQDVEPLGRNHRARDVLSMEELRILFPLDRVRLLQIWKTQKYAALFMTMATSGIRSGEARALQWRHLLSGGWLLVERSCKMDGTIGETKTGEKRVVALPRRTVDELEFWRAGSPFADAEDLVFFGRDARLPLHAETVTHAFPVALASAGILPAGRNLVAHSLRHTYNTVMRAVLPEEILRKFTGHKTPEMTARYDHPALEDQIGKLGSAREVVEGVWK